MDKYIDRFWSRVEKTDSCWLWRAAIASTGYGVFRIKDTLHYAHRFAYELAKGKIADGLELDHLCRVRACCNPDHLEAVTHQVNVDRGLARKKEQCKRGHQLSGENVYFRPDTGARQCLTCKHEYWQQWYAKNGWRRETQAG